MSTVTCPSCEKSFKVPAGRKARCPECGEWFVPEPAAPARGGKTGRKPAKSGMIARASPTSRTSERATPRLLPGPVQTRRRMSRIPGVWPVVLQNATK